jgi:biotin synthase
VARQPDNGSNPRPDNRSGWLQGETPDVLEDYLDAPRSETEAEEGALKIRLWDPSTQLRYKAKRKVLARPDGARNAVPAGWGD